MNLWRPAGGVLALLVAGLVLAWQTHLTVQDAELLRQQREGLNGLVQQRARALNARMSPQDAQRHLQVEQLATQLATPWPEAFALFENRAPRGIVLQRLRVDAASGTLEISGQADSAERLGKYLVALEGDERLGAVLLARHETLHGEPGTPTEFDISATWLQAPRVAALRAGSPASAARIQERP